MKEIFFMMLLIILINFSNELLPWKIKCQPGQAKLCSCTFCTCVTKPKCPIGQVAKCKSRPHMRCYCQEEKISLKLK